MTDDSDVVLHTEFSAAFRNGLCHYDGGWRCTDGSWRGDSNAPCVWMGKHQQARVSLI